MPTCDSHTGLAQSQGAVGVVGGAPKPRVRARRGQATDPHSIAERLRRERIAERMKALQELVPNSNKTDKASMLDEIIEYVKFLQLQVKVLSMSRLGGTAAVAPLVADLPTEGKSTLVAAALGQSAGSSSEDAMAAAEHEVASLMEEDMGTAMQYLQSKGLCLMPISLATAISTTNNTSQAANCPVEQAFTGDQQMQMGVLSSLLAQGNNVPSSLIMAPAGGGGFGTPITNMNQRANLQGPFGAGTSNGSALGAINGPKVNMESSP